MSAWRRPAIAFVLGCAVAALSASYWIAWRAPAIGAFHDDGVYVVTAKALAEGKGYRILSLPNEIAQTKYPILFPLLLSALWRLNPDFPNNQALLKLLPLACGVLWLFLSYRWIRSGGGSKWEGWGIVLCTAASGWTIYLSTAPLSETMFAALTMASLLALGRAERADGGLRHIVIAAALAALAFHTRTVGIALLAAVPLRFAYRREWRPAFAFGVTAALLCLPWLLWVAAQNSGQTLTDAYYSKENYKGWNILFNFAPFEKLHIVGFNLMMILFAPAILAGLPPQGAWLIPMALIGVVVFLGVLRLTDSHARWFLACYIGMLLCWAWAPNRFLAPILPMLYWCGWRLLRARKSYAVTALAAMTAICTVSLALSSQQTLRLGSPVPQLHADDDWRAMAKLVEHLRNYTAPDAVLAGNLDPVFYLFTGRKAIRGFTAEPYSLIYAQTGTPLGTTDRIVANLREQHATHWIRIPDSSFLEEKWLARVEDDILKTHPGLMVLQPGPEGSAARIYSLCWDAPTRSSPASSDLASVR